MADLQIVGASFGTTGSAKPLTAGMSSGQRVQNAHGDGFDAAFSGRLYSLTTAVGGVTVAAGHIIGAGTPLVGIHNPIGSNKLVAINRAVASVNSGTMAAGGFVWGFMGSANSVLTSTGDASICNSGFAIGGSGVRTFVATAMTGFVSVLFRHIGGPTTGAVAANAPHTVFEDTDGGILLQPGFAFGMFAAAAGTSPIVNAAMEFEVLPYMT